MSSSAVYSGRRGRRSSTCDIAFICKSFCPPLPPITSSPVSPQSVSLVLSSEGGGREKVTLALKPAIVFPPGRPASEAAQSVRDGGRARERERERWREGGRERRLPWLPPGRCERTCLSVGRGSAHGGPPRCADVHVCAFVCARRLGLFPFIFSSPSPPPPPPPASPPPPLPSCSFGVLSEKQQPFFGFLRSTELR